MQISTRRPDLIIINKKKKKKKEKEKRTCKIVDFAVLADLGVKLKENEKDKYLDLCSGTEKTVKHESDVYTNDNWCS